MPVENVKRFYEALVNDEELRKKLMQAESSRGEMERSEANVKAFLEAEVLPLAEQIGCSFSFEELKEFEQQYLNTSVNGEATDSELDAVCGGAAYCFGIGYNDKTDSVGHVDGGICLWTLGLTIRGL